MKISFPPKKQILCQLFFTMAVEGIIKTQTLKVKYVLIEFLFLKQCITCSHSKWSITGSVWGSMVIEYTRFGSFKPHFSKCSFTSTHVLNLCLNAPLAKLNTKFWFKMSFLFSLTKSFLFCSSLILIYNLISYQLFFQWMSWLLIQ